MYRSAFATNEQKKKGFICIPDKNYLGRLFLYMPVWVRLMSMYIQKLRNSQIILLLCYLIKIWGYISLFLYIYSQSWPFFGVTLDTNTDMSFIIPICLLELLPKFCRVSFHQDFIYLHVTLDVSNLSGKQSSTEPLPQFRKNCLPEQITLGILSTTLKITWFRIFSSSLSFMTWVL